MSVREVGVVGTGVIGLAIALELADRGVGVSVIGPEEPPQQASKAAGAMLTVFSEVEAHHEESRADLEVRERLRSREIYDQWLDRLRTSDHQIQVQAGTWVIASAGAQGDGAQLSAIADAARRHGHQAEFHPPSEVPGLAPAFGHEAYQALWLPYEGSIDARSLMVALRRAVRRHPSIEWLSDEVSRIDASQSGQLVVHFRGKEIKREKVVLAAGSYLSHLLWKSNLDSDMPPILSGRGIALLVRSPVMLRSAIRTPNRGFACGTHVVPQVDGSIYIGATNRLTTELPTTRGASLDEIGTLIHDASTELNAGFRDAELRETLVGYRPYTLDHLPLVGRTGHDGVLIATATYRTGLTLAPRIAQVVSDEITGPGSIGDYVFRPDRSMSSTVNTEMVHAAAKGLVELACQPGGHLPAGSAEILASFLQYALETPLGLEHNRAVSLAMKRLWERAPVEECVPLLYEVSRRLR